jgi:uncharacterized protein involved in outer membrane biogenesis
MPSHRTLTVSLAIALAAAAGLGAVPWPIDSALPTAAITASLATETGFTFRLGDPQARFRLLPTPRMEITDIETRFSDNSRAFTARQGTVSLRLMPLLMGRLEAGALSFDRLAAQVDTPVAIANWAALAERYARMRIGEAARPGATPAPRRIEISDSTLILSTPRRNLVITDAAGRLFWGGGASSISLSLGGFFRGTPFTASLDGLTPAKLVGDGTSPVTVTFTSAPVTARIEGSVGSDLSRVAANRFTLDVPSFTDAATWLSASLPLHGLIEKASLQGSGTVGFSGFDLTEARVAIGADILEGTIALRLEEAAPQLVGTLATESFDGGSIADFLRATIARPAHILPLGRFAATDFDLRLSASKVRLEGIMLQDVALAAVMARNRLELTLSRAYLGEARIADPGKRRLRARATTTLSDRGLDIKLAANLIESDAVHLAPQPDPAFGLTGLASGDIAVEARGRSLYELLSSLTGHANLQVLNGALRGIDLPALVRQAGQPAPAAPASGGATDFERLAIAAQIRDGLLELKAAELRMPNATAVVLGHLNLADGLIDAAVTLAGAGAGAPLSLGLTGPWRAPRFIPLPAQR